MGNIRKETINGFTVVVNEDYEQVQEAIVAELAKHKEVFAQNEPVTDANQRKGGSLKHPWLATNNGTLYDSHIPENQVLSYIEAKPDKPKRNRILLDGRVVDPSGHTIRNWKDALLEEGIESIEMI